MRGAWGSAADVNWPTVHACRLQSRRVNRCWPTISRRRIINGKNPNGHTTLLRRRYNVDIPSRRRIDVVSTSKQRSVTETTFSAPNLDFHIWNRKKRTFSRRKYQTHEEPQSRQNIMLVRARMCQKSQTSKHTDAAKDGTVCLGAGKLGGNSEWSKNVYRIHRPIAWT